MIIGRTQSADGGYRRVPIRKTQIIDKETKKPLLSKIDDMVYELGHQIDWVGKSDIFPKIPESILGTPFQIIYDKCVEKFKENLEQVNINVSKYLGMMVREAVYSSDRRYFEKMIGSVRKYSIESKHKGEANDYEKNRMAVINGNFHKD